MNNFAVSGATFSTASNNNIYKQANQIQNADLVIIQGTDDDWLYGNGRKLEKIKPIYLLFMELLSNYKAYQITK